MMIPVPSHDDMKELPRFSYVGGYSLLYVATWKGRFHPTVETLCGACASQVRDGIAGPGEGSRTEHDVLTSLEYGTYDSGPPIACDHCQEEIESSYGEPDEDS